jgi:hypothetical protein
MKRLIESTKPYQQIGIDRENSELNEFPVLRSPAGQRFLRLVAMY